METVCNNFQGSTKRDVKEKTDKTLGTTTEDKIAKPFAIEYKDSSGAISNNNSNPEAFAVPFSSSLLKLPSLRSHVWFTVAVWYTRCSKVLHCFTSILWTSQKYLFITYI